MRQEVQRRVEECLREIWRRERVPIDDDGDHPFRAGTAACWVRVDAHPPVLVRVFGHAVEGVAYTPALLCELNDINTRARTTSVAWDEGVVRVMAMLHPSGLAPDSLRHAVQAVSIVASDLGPIIASVHGGVTPHEAEVGDPET